ncbi:MAG: hypothetical protein ACI3ZZ_00605 [Candidatus Aphodosoma sp.]
MNIMPPPRSTIVEWLDRSFGLSIILHLSAMRKYANSKAKRIMKIIP